MNWNSEELFRFIFFEPSCAFHFASCAVTGCRKGSRWRLVSLKSTRTNCKPRRETFAELNDMMRHRFHVCCPFRLSSSVFFRLSWENNFTTAWNTRVNSEIRKQFIIETELCTLCKLKASIFLLLIACESYSMNRFHLSETMQAETFNLLNSVVDWMRCNDFYQSL